MFGQLVNLQTLMKNVTSQVVGNSAQFMKTLEEIAKYVQMKYKSDVAGMIKDVESPEFNFPKRPVPRIVTNVDGTMTQEKKDDMDVYVWKAKKLSSPKKKKRVPNNFEQMFILFESAAKESQNI